MKKKGEAWGDFKGMIRPVLRCSSTKDLHVSISVGLRVNFGYFGGEIRAKVDGMVIGAMGRELVMGFF